MLVPVIKEICRSGGQRDARGRVVGVVGAAEGYDGARTVAVELAARFERSGYERELDYAWGYNVGEPVTYRFLVGTGR